MGGAAVAFEFCAIHCSANFLYCLSPLYPQSTYPQGLAPFIPQALATLAILVNWMAFSGFTLFGIIVQAESFICLRVKQESGGSPNYRSECFGLKLSALEYWSNPDNNLWAWPLVMATLLAIVAICVGGIATLTLLSAICFELDPANLHRVSVSLFIASGCSIMTMIAFATNICFKDDITNCSRDAGRLSDGGALMIAAFFFYMFAGFSALPY
jgi:hypothetical protein